MLVTWGSVLGTDPVSSNEETIVIPIVAKFKRIHVDHSMKNEFHSRTVFTLQQRRSNSKMELSVEEPADMNGVINGVSLSDLQDFKALLKENGLYRIRMHSKPGDDSSPFIYAAIPACELQKSGFREEITVHFDKNDSIIGLEYSSPVIALPRPCDPEKVTAPVIFQTTVKVADKQFAQSIPLNVIGTRPAHMQNIKIGTEDEKPNAQSQSFLAKYWYLILPIAVIVLFGGGGPDEKATPGGAQGGAQPAVGSGPAPKRK
eukprot:gene7947-16275_t